MVTKKIDEQTLFNGVVFDVVKKKYDDDGEIFTREIVKTPDVVHILPFDKNGNIYAIREFRGAIDDMIIGFPAGKIENGELPELSASREVEEEIGMRVVDLYSVSPSIITSSGVITEKGYYYFALVEDIKDEDREHFPDVDEKIEVLKMSDYEFGELIHEKIKNQESIELKTMFLWTVYIVKQQNNNLTK